MKVKADGKLASLMSDPAKKPAAIAMLSLTTLQQYAGELETHAKAIDNGSFKPLPVLPTPSAAKVGETAPDFTITNISGGEYKLSANPGKVRVLIFMRNYWCNFCANQLADLLKHSDEFKQSGAEVVLIYRVFKDGDDVANSIKGLQEKRDSLKVPFIMATDFPPSQATKAYDLENQYGTFIVGKDGKLKKILYGAHFLRPSAEAVLNAAKEAAK